MDSSTVFYAFIGAAILLLIIASRKKSGRAELKKIMIFLGIAMGGFFISSILVQLGAGLFGRVPSAVIVLVCFAAWYIFKIFNKKPSDTTKEEKSDAKKS